MQSPRCIEADEHQQIARTRWFTLQSVLVAAAHVCAYFDGYVQPSLVELSREWSHCWRKVSFVSPLTAKVTAYADVITVFVSCRLDIKAVKKTAAKYEQITGAKINFEKS